MNNEQWNGQVRINKDILTYNEQLFMGLNIKQTVCGAAAILSAVLIYFVCSKFLGHPITIVLCGVVAAPLAAIGFLHFNGMTFLQTVSAILKHYSIPKVLHFKSKSYYKEIITLNQFVEKKEGKKKNDAENIRQNEKAGAER